VPANIEKLNEILADEWAAVRALRRAEKVCVEPGLIEVIKRVRKNSSVTCVSLSGVIRALGGRPTDVPSARFSLQLSDETAGEALDMGMVALQHVEDEIKKLLDLPALLESRRALAAIVQLQREDIRWLKTVGDAQDRGL
jgi:bacterioferritin (cytochrome b1)